MLPLGLDQSGEHVLVEWLESPETTAEDAALVRRVLDDVAWKRPLPERWYTRRDLLREDVVLVYPHERLEVAVRYWSDEDPDRLFSIVTIGSVDPR